MGGGLRSGAGGGVYGGVDPFRGMVYPPISAITLLVTQKERDGEKDRGNEEKR